MHNLCSKKVNIVHNGKDLSIDTAVLLENKLVQNGFEVSYTLENDALVNICIGGDGAFLRTVHRSRFSSIPFLGINTGHLGFFQEIDPSNLDILVNSLINKDYTVEQIDLVEAIVYTKSDSFRLKAINEIAIKGISSKVVHLEIFIDADLFEKVSGDGVIVSTPIGSTAYNFSCGGSVVSPKLKMLQLTPIAPINSKAYRSLNNSLIVPTCSSLIVKPEYKDENSLVIITDGVEHKYSEIQKIKFIYSDYKLNKLAVNEKSFWNNVREKFL
jgi:NAD+ kinase